MILISVLKCGSPLAKHSKEKIEAVDDEKKWVAYSVIGDDLLKYYKSFKGEFSVTPKGEGSLVKWSCEYEKAHEEVPDPTLIRDFAIKNFKEVDEYVGRVGQLTEAENVALTMRVKPDAALWLALLSAAASHGDADMAKALATRLLNLDPYNDAAYVITYNALSAAGRSNEAVMVMKMMKDRFVKKESGRSWVQVRGKVHVFLSGDYGHERRKEIYAKLVELRSEIEKLGYVLEGERKEELWCHSEKLAVAFAVVARAALPRKILRVVKNLRICKDCHKVFKYFSLVLRVEIVVRDANRYHRFFKGT